MEGLVYLVDHGRKDPIVRILVSPEHMELAMPLVGGSNLATELTAEMCEPILRQAAERGEIRADLNISSVAEWPALVQFILVGRLDFAKAHDPGHRKLLRAFFCRHFCRPVSTRRCKRNHPRVDVKLLMNDWKRPIRAVRESAGLRGG